MSGSAAGCNDHQCEGTTARGVRCQRKKSTLRNGKWLCKQHGGFGVMPSCAQCKKVLGDWPDTENRNICRTCGTWNRITAMASQITLGRTASQVVQAQRPQVVQAPRPLAPRPQVVQGPVDEDPVNCE